MNNYVIIMGITLFVQVIRLLYEIFAKGASKKENLLSCAGIISWFVTFLILDFAFPSLQIFGRYFIPYVLGVCACLIALDFYLRKRKQ